MEVYLTYKLNPDGTITFTPERNFVGKTSGVKVRGYDSNGLSADTTYTPTVIMKVEYYDPMSEKPNETVDTGEAKKSNGSDVSTEYEGNDKTKSKNHKGWRFDGWTEEVVEDDTYGIKHVRTAHYTPMYNINYDANGGTGTMADDDYAADDSSMPDKDNTFTRKGYTFKGFYAYIKDPTTGKETIITDADGNPILFTSAQDMKEYFQGMPAGTSIRMEAQWQPNTDPDPNPVDNDDDDDDSVVSEETKKVVSTGDDTEINLWISLMQAAIAAMMIMIANRKRNIG